MKQLRKSKQVTAAVLPRYRYCRVQLPAFSETDFSVFERVSVKSLLLTLAVARKRKTP